MMRQAVEACMGKDAYQLSASNSSHSGKYLSLNLETVVLNEDFRNRIYSELKNNSSVTMVL